MTQLRKVWPQGSLVSPGKVFNVVFISEGYTSGQERAFYEDCQITIKQFQGIAPFNLLDQSINRIHFYSHFAASNNSGPSIDSTPAADRTLLQSQLNTTTQLLSLDMALLHSLVETLEFYDYAGNRFVSLLDTIQALGPVPHVTQSLVVVLLPQVNGNGGEVEYWPSDEDEFYFIGMTQNGNWSQVLARSVAMKLGLAVEADRDGTDFLAPAAMLGTLMNAFTRNVVYVPNTTNFLFTPQHAWYGLIPAALKEEPVSVHGHPHPTTGRDLSIQDHPESYHHIELWEGAGGYRTKIYRSAKDCLMRREIGNTALPVRNTRVPFCFVCRHYLKNLIS